MISIFNQHIDEWSMLKLIFYLFSQAVLLYTYWDDEHQKRKEFSDDDDNPQNFGSSNCGTFQKRRECKQQIIAQPAAADEC